MAERIRLFKGATELEYSEATITVTDDYVVNTGNIEFGANAVVTNASVIDYKKSDGSTNVFSGKVQNLKKDMLWNASIFTNGYELMNVPVQNVYINRSPEYIVQDVVNNYTDNLTFVSGTASGFTVGVYIAKGYAIDIIKDMMDILGWNTRIDVNDNVYFEPDGTFDNGFMLTNGSNCQITEWEESQDELFNHVKVVGGFESFTTKETVSGTGTDFTLSSKPAGTLIAYTSSGGTEISPGDYEVNAEEKTVTFDSSQTDPYFEYSYDRPIIVENQNDSSINTYGEIYKELQAPWLSTFADARKYSQSLLDIYSIPLLKTKAVQPGMNFDIDVSETAIVTDNVRNRNATLVIKKITYNARSNQTVIELGSRTVEIGDWQREVEERIKKIEQRALNEEDIIFTRLFKSGLSITISKTESRQYNEPKDTFTLSHPTLNRLRTVVNGHIENYEADCTDNGHYGTWYGSNVDGSQYVFPAYRLYGGDFNGTDTYVQAVDTISGVQSIVFFAKPTNASEDIIQLTGSAYISINGLGNITTTGLTNPTIYINAVADISIGTGTYKLVTITCDSIDATDLEIGRHSSSYYTGELDEVLLFDSKITTANMQTIIDKNWYDDNNDYTISGCLLHWAMDNPKLGIRETTRADI